jgi:hypothetical protein
MALAKPKAAGPTAGGVPKGRRETDVKVCPVSLEKTFAGCELFAENYPCLAHTKRVRKSRLLREDLQTAQHQKTKCETVKRM